MSVYSVLPPFLVFPDSDGTPLENGQIFIGQPGFEARTTPKASFFDTAQTIPTGTATGAAIRTMGGFPARNGSPAMFYVDGDFSISVLDRNGVLLYSALNTTLAINLGAITTGPILAPDGNVAAVGLGFINEANTGWIRSSAGTVQYIVQGSVVAQMTATGVTFNQTVGGTGFSAGVLAIAQPLDANLTQLATPGAVGTMPISDGTNIACAIPTLTTIDYQSFTANGTWTKPSGFSTNSLVVVELCGGGGGGGGGGGTGGGWRRRRSIASHIPQAVAAWCDGNGDRRCISGGRGDDQQRNRWQQYDIRIVCHGIRRRTRRRWHRQRRRRRRGGILQRQGRKRDHNHGRDKPSRRR